MMTHTSPELRRGLHLTRHTTSQITVSGPSQPFKIRMFGEDDIQAAVRSAEPEAFAECSFRVSLHFSPALAAVRRSVPDSGWPTVTMGQIQISRHRDGGQMSLIQWWWWYIVMMVTCVVSTRVLHSACDQNCWGSLLWAQARRALCPRPRGHQVLREATHRSPLPGVQL